MMIEDFSHSGRVKKMQTSKIISIIIICCSSNVFAKAKPKQCKNCHVDLSDPVDYNIIKDISRQDITVDKIVSSAARILNEDTKQ